MAVDVDGVMFCTVKPARAIAELVAHGEQLAPQCLKTIALGRFAQAVKVANGPLLLADEAADVTGQTIVVDEGQTLRICGDLEQAAGYRRYGKGRT